MKALIFGANGQDGHYLNALLRENGVESVGISRSGDWVRGDVAARGDVEALIRQHKPDFVFHLAANSTTRHEALWENQATIGDGTLHILEAVKQHSPASRVFLSGSGLQFVNTGNPVSERDPFEASSAYSLARIQSVYAARYYRTLGLRIYVGYLFHHDSPLRKPQHVAQLIALATRRIKQGSEELLELGDVSVQKEWTFAGDVVRGMWTLVQQDEVFEATIGSGVSHSIEEWLNECFALIGRDWRDHVRLREGFLPEYGRLVSDPATIFLLGWRPLISFSELARLMVLGERT